MQTVDRLFLGPYEFAVAAASFRYITRSWSGPGWDFGFSGPCLNDDPEAPLFPYGARLFTADLHGRKLTPLPEVEPSAFPAESANSAIISGVSFPFITPPRLVAFYLHISR